MAYRDMPRIPRRQPNWAKWALILLGVIIVVSLIAGTATDFFWYREVGRTDVYWTMFWGRWLIGLLVGGGFFAVVFLNVLLALRETPPVTWSTLGRNLRERALDVADHTARRIIVLFAVVVIGFFALGVGKAAAGYWPQFLLFTHGKATGTIDPLFKHDVAFYLFRLPVLELLNDWFFFAVVLGIVLTALVYLSTQSIRFLRGVATSSGTARAHLSILLALVFLSKGAGYLLARYGLLYEPHSLLVGASYADVHAKLPGLYIMMALAVIAAAVTLVSINFRNIKLLLWYVAGLIAASVVVLNIWPGIVQRLRVTPNELRLEQPYLQHHMRMTRAAYGLDKVQSVPFTPKPTVRAEVLRAAEATVGNVRLWDTQPLIQTYSQRQDIRTYYQINNVDIDRYTINGKLRQVMLSAREINVSQMDAEKQTWVNRHLIYTHGYGVVMSPVNTFDLDSSEPEYLIKDIPPVSPHPELRITRPEIYFGEVPNSYVVVKTKQREFDYPRGDSANQETTYQADAGIALRNPLVRLLFAVRFGALDLLISDYITGDSRILIKRQVLERAQAAAPFLTFDRDPYIVVGRNGRLYWIIDAYTRSIRYPYAQRTTLEVAGGEAGKPTNYVRNPVKAVVDAYTGAVSVYTVDPEEPFIRAWREVFPKLFQPMTALPGGLEKHLRVPDGLFNTQSEIFRRYHMTDVQSFYQSEDLWDIPRESNEINETTTRSTGPNTMPGYYIVMNRPGEREPEYLLIRPYTPNEKDNMIAWLSARNDPGHFGELLVYTFSRQSALYGPVQIEKRINQAPEISQAFSLWDAKGSRVRKGNLLVIPLGDSLLYVRPIYLVAEERPIPQLQRVIVADQERIVMRRTLEEALEALTGSRPAGYASSNAGILPEPDQAPPANLTDAQRAHAREALTHYRRAQDALKQGDWTTYGKEMDSLQKELEAINR